jgi:hypothetical protein
MDSEVDVGDEESSLALRGKIVMTHIQVHRGSWMLELSHIYLFH